MSYNKRLTKEQRKQIKNARRQNRELKAQETAKLLVSVRRYGK